MKKKFSKSTILELIETLGFDKAYDIIKENDPESLLLPDPLGTSSAQGYLFEDPLMQIPLEDIIRELDEFFEISPEDLRPHDEVDAIEMNKRMLISWLPESRGELSPEALAIAA